LAKSSIGAGFEAFLPGKARQCLSFKFRPLLIQTKNCRLSGSFLFLLSECNAAGADV